MLNNQSPAPGSPQKKFQEIYETMRVLQKQLNELELDDPTTIVTSQWALIRLKKRLWAIEGSLPENKAAKVTMAIDDPKRVQLEADLAVQESRLAVLEDGVALFEYYEEAKMHNKIRLVSNLNELYNALDSILQFNRWVYYDCIRSLKAKPPGLDDPSRVLVFLGKTNHDNEIMNQTLFMVMAAMEKDFAKFMASALITTGSSTVFEAGITHVSATLLLKMVLKSCQQTREHTKNLLL